MSWHEGVKGAGISDDTKALITTGVSENTLRNYRFWSRGIEVGLKGRSLNDGLLAEYITGPHTQGKSPVPIPSEFHYVEQDKPSGRSGAVAGSQCRHRGRCAVPSGSEGAIISRRVDCRLGLHAVGLPTGQG